MATCIHHGPPGSYKSFTVVQRHAIPALREGRVIVTNIRGFNSLDLIKEQFPDVEFPDTAQIIWVDTKIQEGRDLMARWFHWVPFRAMIIIDEAQRIYPDRRDFKLESLDQFDFDMAVETLPEPRPEDVFTAFDMQRHYQWDLFLSTPNIAKIKREIREVTEWAYRHRDVSKLLPWLKNTWYEHQHDPETSGKSLSHVVGVPVRYKADPRVFSCYQSTATGEHTDSTAGRSALADPKLRIRLFIVVAALAFLLVALVGKFSDASPAPAPADASSPDPAEKPRFPVPSAPIEALPVPVAFASRQSNSPDDVNYVGIYAHDLKTGHLTMVARVGTAFRKVPYETIIRHRVDVSIKRLCAIVIGGVFYSCQSDFDEYCSGSVTGPDFHRKIQCRFDGSPASDREASSGAVAVRRAVENVPTVQLAKSAGYP